MGARLSKEQLMLESRAVCTRGMWEADRRRNRTNGTLAAPQGFEPRYPAPEAGVLPLNEGAVPPHYPMSSKAGQMLRWRRGRTVELRWTDNPEQLSPHVFPHRHLLGVARAKSRIWFK